MKLTDLVSALTLETHAGAGNLERPVTGGIVSDLLSYVMGKAQAGNLWVTIQVHPNIVGVADLLDLSAVVVAGGQEPEAATVAKAREHGIALLTTKMSAFTLVGKLHELGAG